MQEDVRPMLRQQLSKQVSNLVSANKAIATNPYIRVRACGVNLPRSPSSRHDLFAEARRNHREAVDVGKRRERGALDV